MRVTRFRYVLNEYNKYLIYGLNTDQHSTFERIINALYYSFWLIEMYTKVIRFMNVYIMYVKLMKLQ